MSIISWNWHGFGTPWAGLFLKDLIIQKKLTDTIILLVSKKKNPQLMKDLRPISLCNVLYKIVAKVLENRLKEVIQSFQMFRVRLFQVA